MKEIVMVDVDPSSWEKAMLKIVETVKGLCEDEVVIDATGGSRALILIVLLSAIVLSTKCKVSLYVQSDTGEGWEVMLRDNQIRLLRPSLTKEKLRIILEIKRRPGVSVEELSDILNVKEKTLKNRLGELRGEGLVVRKGRGGGVFLTPWGKIVAEMFSLSSP